MLKKGLMGWKLALVSNRIKKKGFWWIHGAFELGQSKNQPKIWGNKILKHTNESQYREN